MSRILHVAWSVGGVHCCVARRRQPRRRQPSPKTSPRSSRTSAKRVTGRIRSRRCRSSRSKSRGPGRGRSRTACSRGRCRPGTSTRPSASRNSRTIARSPTRRSRRSRSGSTPARRRAIRRTCRPPKQWPSEQGWNFAKHFGQTEPDLIVKSLPWTQKAGANDAWWKPVVETHLTEPRWVRAIEIRPSTVKGRKITHHAIARLQQQETDALAMNPLDANGNPLPGTFMEWAVGKQGEMMRPNSGKLMLPGAKIVWDIHYSNGGEDITDTGRARRLLLSERPGAEVPPGAAPDGRHQRQRQRRQRARFGRRHSAQHREGHRRLLPAARERPRRELPAAHAPARQGDGDGSDPAERSDPGAEPRGRTSTSTGTTPTSTRRPRRRCCRRAR